MLLGLKQAEVGSMIGVSEGCIWNWENGYSAPGTRFLARVYNFLGYCLWKPVSTFPDWLRQARRAMGLSDRKLSRLVGIDPTTLTGWESGRHQPSEESKRRVERRLRSHWGGHPKTP